MTLVEKSVFQDFKMNNLKKQYSLEMYHQYVEANNNE